jgi:TonB family protein
MPLAKRRTLAALLLILAACPAWAQLITERNLRPQAVLKQTEPASTADLDSSEPAPCAVKLPGDTGELHPKRLDQSRKVIHDRAEYKAYMAALELREPRQKATTMEEFVTRYPESTVKADALAQAMAAYQASGNATKVGDMAARLLQMQPDNLRALSIIVFLARDCATRGAIVDTNDAGKRLLHLAQRGLVALPDWQEAQGASLPNAAKLRDEMAAIFAGAAGWGALENKDYGVAREFYEKALAIDPKNLPDLYQIAVADLSMSPIDPNGFWYCGKAISIAQVQDKSAAWMVMSPFCTFNFKKHGGKQEEWDRLVSSTEKDTAPPQDFAKAISLQEPNQTLQKPNQTSAGAALSPPSEKGDPISMLVIPPTNSGPRVGAGISSSSVLVIPETEVGVSPPIATYLRRPLYPKSASDTKIKVSEKLEITIDVDGNVSDITVINTLGPEFDREAIAAAKQWKFKPATKDGKPVTSKELSIINFYPGMPAPAILQDH